MRQERKIISQEKYAAPEQELNIKGIKERDTAARQELKVMSQEKNAAAEQERHKRKYYCGYTRT